MKVGGPCINEVVSKDLFALTVISGGTIVWLNFMTPMSKRLVICLSFALLASLGATQATGQDKKNPKVDVSKLPPASTAKNVTYAKDIKPIFEKSCTKCHGAEKQKGKLRLDSLEAALKGGEDGKVVLPGDS